MMNCESTPKIYLSFNSLLTDIIFILTKLASNFCDTIYLLQKVKDLHCAETPQLDVKGRRSPGR